MWRGERHVRLEIDGDDKSVDATLYVVRDTPHGLTDLEFKQTWSLFGDDASDPQDWARNVLVTVLETL